MPVMHEEVHERAEREDQERKEAERVSPVLLRQEQGGDAGKDEEGQQGPPSGTAPCMYIGALCHLRPSSLIAE
jgi:hypothetical protein